MLASLEWLSHRSRRRAVRLSRLRSENVGARAGLGPETVLAECRGDSVWALDVAVIRDLGCGLVADPASDGFSVDPAHALLTVDPDLGRGGRKRVLRGLVAAARHVAGEVPAWPPP